MKYIIGQLFTSQFLDMEKDEIKSNLESIAFEIERGEYQKILTEDELTEKKSLLSEVEIELHNIEIKRKEYLAAIKAMKAAPMEKKEILVNELKTKTEKVNGELYAIDDDETRNIYIFNESGICVDVRPFSAKNDQSNIFSILKNIENE